MTTKSVKEIIKDYSEFDVNTETILAYINEGLEAKYLEKIVYDTDLGGVDDPTPPPKAPSMKQRREATRNYALKKMCEGRGQPPIISDVSEHPNNYHGMSFKLPQDIEERERVVSKINEFTIIEEEFLRYLPSEKDTHDNITVKNDARSNIIEYAKRRQSDGNPLVRADFIGDSITEINKISKEYNVTLDTLRKYVSSAGYLSPSKRGPKNPHQ